jgi:CBS domain-containing protein
MNITRFLTPKSDVAHLSDRTTVETALDAFEKHGYTAVPVVTDDGRYVGTLSAADLLWHLRRVGRRRSAARVPEGQPGPPPAGALRGDRTRLGKLERRSSNPSVPIGASVESLFDRLLYQSFVPVIDDRGVFVGIVKRSTVLAYLSGLPAPAVQKVDAPAPRAASGTDG